MSELVLPPNHELMYFDGTTDHVFKSRLTGEQLIPRRFFVGPEVSSGIYELYAVQVLSSGIVFGSPVGLQTLTTFPVGSTVRRGSKSQSLPVQLARTTNLDFVPNRIHTTKNLLQDSAVFDLFYTSEVS